MTQLPDKPTAAATEVESIASAAAQATGSCRFLHRWGPWDVKVSQCDIQQFRVCEHCGKVAFRDLGLAHDWGHWQQYEFTRSRELDDEVVDGVKQIAVTHQMRHCKVCGFAEDRFMRYGPFGITGAMPAPGASSGLDASLPLGPPPAGHLLPASPPTDAI
jgi:hypothetical protein